MNKQKRILIAPLDWGLGHATRCIPIIREFILRGCDVKIASSGDALILLKEEFPRLEFFELPSYRAVYSKRFPLMMKMLFQVPKFLTVIRQEHLTLERLIKENQIDLVISDNRFGCWTNKVPSVFMMHQINIQMHIAWKWIQPIVNYANHRQLKKFSQCWVPDFPDRTLTAKLTEPGKLRVRFIGMLSRFQSLKNISPTYDYLALVSGPEPQRTIFEQKIRMCFAELKGRKVLVRGLPGLSEEIVHLTDWDEVTFMNGERLQHLIASSALVICRSGYSSIMDLAKMSKRAVFVPTPGQTEQEYLADQLMKNNIARSVTQDSLSASQIQSAQDCIGFTNGFSDDLLKKEIDAVLEKL